MIKTLKRWQDSSPKRISEDASRVAIFFCLDDAKKDILQLGAIVERVARLNPDADEIGPGMLKQLVTDARRVLGE